MVFGIYGDEPIITIPVRPNVSGDDVSHGIEAISDKVPIIAVGLDEVLQELVVLRCPKLVSDTRLLYALGIGGGGSNDEMIIAASLE